MTNTWSRYPDVCSHGEVKRIWDFTLSRLHLVVDLYHLSLKSVYFDVTQQNADISNKDGRIWVSCAYFLRKKKRLNLESLTCNSSKLVCRLNTTRQNNFLFSFQTLRNSVFSGMTDVRCTPRQTDIWINQYPCHWIKSNSSSHVLRAVCSRLLILSRGTPLTSEPLLGIVLMQIRRGNQFIVAQFD